jgi:hypothetical protein
VEPDGRTARAVDLKNTDPDCCEQQVALTRPALETSSPVKGNFQMSPNDRLLRAAVVYAKRFGFAVFPVGHGSTIPVTAHGCKDATRDAQKICAWWRRWPNANVGIATGATSGIFVLDIDFRAGGDESLAALEGRNGKLPGGAPIVSTPGGGWHYYFRAPSEVEVRNSAGVLAPGLDLRGEGGYVLGPPSIHPNGERYVWKASAHIRNVVPAEAPEYLLQLISFPPASRHDAGSGNKHLSSRGTAGETRGGRVELTRLVAGVSKGQRDWELFRLACSLRRRGHSRGFVEEVVLDVARRCHPPFPDRDARRKVASAWSYS